MIEVLKQALKALESYHNYMEPLTTVFGGPRVPAEQSTTGKVEKAITSLRQAIAELESQEPVGWVDLQKEAQQIVESKFLWKKFIDGTPLANDIACWMADFALQHTHPQLTEQNFCPRCGKRTNDIHTCTPPIENNT